LLVDDEQEWRGLIRRALPSYHVDAAGSYDEAMAFLDEGMPYDVAIVDLNLLEKAGDLLGGDVLRRLRELYPSTPRIALTGEPPNAVAEVFSEYGLVDLVIKRGLKLGVVRRVVEGALASDPAGVSPVVRTERAELWENFRTWRRDRRERFEHRTRKLEKDLQDERSAGKPGEDLAAKLDVYRDWREKFEAQASVGARMIAGIRTREDVGPAAQELTRLRGTFGAKGESISV
jgi:CheY-like chemotaxis protein